MHEIPVEIAGNLIPVSVQINHDDAIPVEVSPAAGGSGLTNDIKEALLQIARKVVYVDAGGQTYYNALYEALYPLASISAVYTQSGTVYDTDTLDSLKADLVVTATYGDGNTETVPSSDYTLSGTLTAGTSTITVTYEGKTATFTVTVTAAPATLSYIEAVYTQSGTVYNTDSLDTLKTGLVVTAHYSDSTTATVPSADYTLSGTLTAGTSTVTVTYEGKTDTFSVTVTANTVASISAVYTQSGTVYTTDSLDSLKTDLVVTATYADTSTATVPSTDYTLSGTLEVGTSTITVSYQSKTTTFTVVVSNIPAEYQEVEYIGFDGNCRIVTSAGIDTNAEYIGKVQFNTPTGEHAVACLANTTASTQSIEVTSGTLYRTFFYVSASLAITNISGLYAYPSDIHVKYQDGVKSDYWLTNNGTDYHAESTQTQQNPQAFAGCVFVIGNARTNTQKYGFSGKVYSMKYIKAGALAADLVPCYRKADSVIGFYDKVTNAFLTNSGSGTLTKGSDVA